MTPFDDIVKADNIELLECIYDQAKHLRRDADDVSIYYIDILAVFNIIFK
jgi:hypothetical protein